MIHESCFLQCFFPKVEVQLFKSCFHRVALSSSGFPIEQLALHEIGLKLAILFGWKQPLYLASQHGWVRFQLPAIEYKQVSQNILQWSISCFHYTCYKNWCLHVLYDYDDFYFFFTGSLLTCWGVWTPVINKQVDIIVLLSSSSITDSRREISKGSRNSMTIKSSQYQAWGPRCINEGSW